MLQKSGISGKVQQQRNAKKFDLITYILKCFCFKLPKVDEIISKKNKSKKKRNMTTL
jgi:hypothetical protein